MLNTINISQFFQNNIKAVVVTIIALVLGVLSSLIVSLIINQKIVCSNDSIKKIRTNIQSIVYTTHIFVVALIICDSWGFNVYPFLIIFTIIMIALLIAFNGFIKDVTSGVKIYIGEWYNVGDTVEIDGFKGTVSKLTVYSTTIVNLSGEEKNISNRFIGQAINYSKKLNVGYVDVVVDSSVDCEELINLLVDNLDHLKDDYPQIIEGPNVLGIVEFTNQGYKVRIVVKTNTEDVASVERGIRRFVKKILQEHNINLNVSQVKLYDNQK